MRTENGMFTTKYNKLSDVGWLTQEYVNLRKSTTTIASELGCVPSTVFVALQRSGIKQRTCSEARIGIKFSKQHLENITNANRKMAKAGSAHWNWQGGKSTEYEKKMTRIKADPKYKAWRRAVIECGFCKICGSNDKLQAHHILPKALYPHLMLDIANGLSLCRRCHINLHLSENGKNSGNTTNPEPSQVKVLEGAETTGEQCTALNNQN